MADERPGGGTATTGPGGTATTGLRVLGPLPGPVSGRAAAILPPLVPVRQRFDLPAVTDLAGAVRRALAPLAGTLEAGTRVAITAGSRGIADIAAAVAEAGAVLRSAGAEPFVVPAMGSHGGATAEGQVAVLAHLGMTEERLGMPIRATMETVELGRIEGGPAVLLDANAAGADKILALNRVKPHTDFRAPIESGIAKVLAIGLGKQRGAEGIHAYGPEGLAHFIPEVARRIVATGKVLGGLAIIENAEHQVARIELVAAEGIGAKEEADLLVEASRLMGRLPFDELDVLVLDEMGKDHSGCGMDPNVLGRMRIENTPEPDSPSIGVVAVLGLSEATDGNACGIGLADITTQRLFESIDVGTTYVNILTSGLGGIRRGQIPIVLPGDREAIGAAVASCGVPDLEDVRLVRIHDTNHLGQLLVSPSLLQAVAEHPRLEVCGEPGPIAFDASGMIAPWPRFS